MTLICDWKRQWPKLWSVRFALMAAFASAVEVGVNLYVNGTPPVMASLAFAASLGAAITRVVAQPALHDG
jgi:hypothetical protein